MELYTKEREGKPNADCQSRSPMPSTSAEFSFSAWGQARQMRAGKAGGGRRDWWGQATSMWVASHWPGARVLQHRGPRKPPSQIPSQHSPFGPRPSKQNNTTNVSLRSSSKFQIQLYPNPKEIQINSVNPSIQSENKEIHIIQILPVILFKSNVLYKFAEFNSSKGLSESICQHFRICHVLELDLAFGFGFINRVVSEL